MRLQETSTQTWHRRFSTRETLTPWVTGCVFNLITPKRILKRVSFTVSWVVFLNEFTFLVRFVLSCLGFAIVVSITSLSMPLRHIKKSLAQTAAIDIRYWFWLRVTCISTYVLIAARSLARRQITLCPCGMLGFQRNTLIYNWGATANHYWPTHDAMTSLQDASADTGIYV